METKEIEAIVKQIRNDLLFNHKKIAKTLCKNMYLCNEYRYINMIKKFKFKLNTSKIESIILRAYKTDINDSMIFGILYIDVDQNSETYNKILYLNHGPSYISMDGEYRRHFTPYYYFTDIIDMEEFDALLDIVDEFIDDINIIAQSSTISHKLDDSELPKYIYALQWLNMEMARYNKFIDVHQHPKYVAQVLPLNSENYYAKLIDKQINVRKLIRVSILDNNLGQKLQTLSIYDIQNYMKPECKIWLEQLCNNLFTNLVFNNICPGFPINLGSFTLDQDENAFDNPSMHKKFNKAKRVVISLDEIEEINHTNPIVSESLMNELDYKKKKMMLSDKMLCTISEYVGRTVASTIKMLDNDITNLYIGDFYSDRTIYMRYLFDLVYALYTINNHAYIMHGDLHLNNCTFNIAKAFKQYDSILEKTYIYYILNDKKYTMRHYGSYLMIIDYSRCIMSPKSEISEDMVNQLREQLLSIYEREFKHFYEKNKNEIEVACLKHPHEVWMLLTAYDVYSFITKLIAISTKKWSTECAKVNSDILDICNKYLIDCMEELFKDVIPDKLPNARLLQYFDEYTNTIKDKDAVFVDFYIWQEPGKLKYDIRDCNKVPNNFKKLYATDLCEDIEHMNNMPLFDENDIYTSQYDTKNDRVHLLYDSSE